MGPDLSLEVCNTEIAVKIEIMKVTQKRLSAQRFLAVSGDVHNAKVLSVKIEIMKATEPQNNDIFENQPTLTNGRRMYEQVRRKHSDRNRRCQKESCSQQHRT